MSTSKRKLFTQIPVISHNSEKPSIASEEMSSGKIFPSLHNYLSTKKKEEINSNNKKYKEIPIISHESEKPTLVFEEITSGKINSFFPNSLTCYNEEKNKLKCKKNEILYKIHESEKPSLTFEEIGSGKLHSSIQTSITNYKEENISSNKLKGGKYIEKEKKSNIAIHNSEPPSIVFEESSAGNKYKSYFTSVTEYKEEPKSIKLKCEKKDECKKTIIKVYESEKPSVVFEQINSGKLYSNIRTSETDYLGIKKLVKIDKKMPIIIHDSEKPCLVFEEANTGIMLDFNHLI
jgi:hypothetical protein